jgi:hypothetical protein
MTNRLKNSLQLGFRSARETTNRNRCTFILTVAVCLAGVIAAFAFNITETTDFRAASISPSIHQLALWTQERTRCPVR